MRYNVYVVTAAQFAANLYGHLLAGRSLGEAAGAARRALAADPARHIGAAPVALQDWAVPVIYEAAPLALLRPATRAAPLITLTPSDSPGRDEAQGEAPRPPDAGFFGRDETLLALDRAFDTQPAVLLHAYAGAGKSATAAEFARWYAPTGGLDQPGHPEWGPGPVIWSSFEQYLSLERLLNAAGDRFSGLLEANGIQWQAITEPAQRRELVLQVLEQVPALWIWDNVEPVAGFPAGTPSAWTPGEQDELASFLRDLAQRTRCKVLLTSRRAEDGWLGGLPVRVKLPPMPMRERLQLATAIAARRGDLAADADWRPLLRYTAGNPLTITVLVGQALRENLTTTTSIEAFVARLRVGEAALEPGEDEALGRTRSLAASLGYGFARAFTDPERDQLALLHLFRDTVDVDALRYMGDAEIAGDDVVSQLAGLTRDTGITLLDRAADIGLLTPLGIGSGYYAIHPALPWYFGTLFAAGYGQPGAAGPVRAYARALGDLGNYYHNQNSAGRLEQVMAALGTEEANLRNGLTVALASELWRAAVGCLQGLNSLYGRTGRQGEWARLVEQVSPYFTDPATSESRPGRDEYATFISSYRVQIATDARDWATAIRLQHAAITWHRKEAAAALAAPPAELTSLQRNELRTLAVGVDRLGEILRLQDDVGCLTHYEEALGLYRRIGAQPDEARIAVSLGNAYEEIPALRDLDLAEQWYRRSLELLADNDRFGRAICLANLGDISIKRFDDARENAADEAALLEYLNAALRDHQQALSLRPTDDPEGLAVSHNQLGAIYRRADDTRQALHHYQQAINHHEDRGDVYGAGRTRYNVALLLANDGRPGDALDYARAALHDYQRIGPGAASRIAKAQQLVAWLEQEGP
jgi:tetratricopeptide (TPR) repeat protein